MSEDLQPLLLDLISWVCRQPRRYDDIMAAWRTSCPRLPVWEEAIEQRYLIREWHADIGAMVSVTSRGRRFLMDNNRLPVPPLVHAD
jgi:hypothetical protein